MDLVIEAFHKEISDIRKHIEFINELKNDIIPSSKNYEYLKSSSRKKIDYNSLIISLYGIVENFIEKFVKSFLEQIEKEIKDYSSLNFNFIDNHFNLSVSLLNKIIDGKHSKFNHLKKEDIVLTLNNCLLNKKAYNFNKEAFLLNTGNLKHSKVSDVLNGLNVNLNKEIKSYDGFDLNTENLFNKIDDLVQRRNEIAHGNVTDILDNSEIIPYVDFIEKYLSAVFCILKSKSDNEKINYFKKKGTKLDDFKIFKGNIIGIEGGKKMNLSIGNPIIIEKKDKSILSTIIELKEFDNDDITFKLKINIRSGNSLFVNF